MSKAERRAAAQKKAKRNRTIMVCAGVLLAVVFIAVVIFAVTRPEIGARVYATGAQRLTLYDDGRFSFMDCQFVRTGNYTETPAGDTVIVEFTHNNRTVRGSISDGILTIPDEWDAGKGHDPRLRLQ
jgi:hypothetical protein